MEARVWASSNRPDMGPQYHVDMGIQPWPTLTLLMEGGPDDGLVVLRPAGASPVPPEELRSAVDPIGGRYLRHPEPASRWTWTYRWANVSAPTDGESTAERDE